MGRITDAINAAVVETVKKQVFELTEQFCRQWYRKHPQMRNTISEMDFTKKIVKELRISEKSNHFHVELQPCWNKDLQGESFLYESFEKDLEQFISSEF